MPENPDGTFTFEGGVFGHQKIFYEEGTGEGYVLVRKLVYGLTYPVGIIEEVKRDATHYYLDNDAIKVYCFVREVNQGEGNT